MEVSINQAIQRAWARLTVLDEPRLEAELLLAFILHKPRTYLFAWPEKILTAQQLTLFDQLLSRRLAGEPIAYIIGRREFWSLDLHVTAATLIPRPETELLVEKALALIPIDKIKSIVDLGTGCGAIAAAIAKERPKCQITAIDLSADALMITVDNLLRLGLENVTCLQGDWYQPISPNRRFDFILSNPPYVKVDDPHLQQGDLRWEPYNALIAGQDGLTAIRRIIAGASDHLRQGGWLLLEHAFDQGLKVRQLMQEVPFKQIHTLQDLGQHERVTLGRI